MTGALTRLQTSLDRIRDVADDMDTRLLTPHAEVRARDETLRCACTVILSGFLETFLKECVSDFVRVVASRRVPFSKLPDSTQKRHFVEGGQLVGQVMRGDGKVSWITATHVDLARRLASATGTGEYELVWEAFANTQGNPSPSVIEEILKHLGVDKRRERLNLALAGDYPTVALQLSSFIAVRNECAHTGTTLNIPSPASLRDYCLLLKRVADAVVLVLLEALKNAPFGVNFNTATAAELTRIPGFGASRAQALVAYRAANGRLLNINDLARVPGIGAKLAASLSMYGHI